MGFSVCYIKNISGSALDLRRYFDIDEEYQIPDSSRIGWANSSVVDDAICSDQIQVGDGSQYFSDHDKSLNHLKMANDTKDIEGHVVNYTPAFAEKKLADGSKLYKRLHGMVESLSSGSNDVIFICPHAHVKIIGARIVGGEIGDYCDFRILDDTSGTYFGTPNAVLNQYGYSVAIAPDNHIETCRYDADLYYGMQIKFTYNSVSAKTVGFNFDMSEVVAP